MYDPTIVLTNSSSEAQRFGLSNKSLSEIMSLLSVQTLDMTFEDISSARRFTIWVIRGSGLGDTVGVGAGAGVCASLSDVDMRGLIVPGAGGIVVEEFPISITNFHFGVGRSLVNSS